METRNVTLCAVGQLYADGIPAVAEYRPLWWHTAGLQQTASGYVRKLATYWMVRYNGRQYRVYCCCYSNSGTCYIVTKGNPFLTAQEA